MNSPHSPRLLAIGAAHPDRRGRLMASLSPGASHPGSITETIGGAAFNVIRTVAASNVQVTFLSVRGGDAAGQTVANAIEGAGIKDMSATFLDRATPSYTSILDQDGEQIVGLADMALYDDVLDRILRRRMVRDNLATATALLVDANLPPSALQRVAEISGEKPLFAMAVSPAKVVRLAPLLPRLACLFCNRAEATALAGQEAGNDAIALCKALVSKGLKRALVSSGAGKLTVLDGNEIFALTPVSTKVVDVTGAGDALAGATLAACLHGRNFREAAIEGLAAAALAVQTENSIPDLAAPDYRLLLETAKRLNAS